MRLLYLAAILAIVLAAAVVFELKSDTGQSAARVVELEQQIELERKNILMLNAEFSVLSQPERMQKIVERYPDYFPLVQATADHFVNLNNLPVKELAKSPLENRELGGLASNITSDQ